MGEIASAGVDIFLQFENRAAFSETSFTIHKTRCEMTDATIPALIKKVKELDEIDKRWEDAMSEKIAISKADLKKYHNGEDVEIGLDKAH